MQYKYAIASLSPETETVPRPQTHPNFAQGGCLAKTHGAEYIPPRLVGIRTAGRRFCTRSLIAAERSGEDRTGTGAHTFHVAAPRTNADKTAPASPFLTVRPRRHRAALARST